MGTEAHGFPVAFKVGLLVFLSCSLVGLPNAALGAGDAMKGPPANHRTFSPQQEMKTSTVDLTFLASIEFYQRWISPIGGGKERCGFSPSCSAYGYEAVELLGPLPGLVMTADRLMRCNIWKRFEPDYTQLPNGKLYDPPSRNLLWER